MEFKFKIQQYQTEAVENVVNVFKGQPNQGTQKYRVDNGRKYDGNLPFNDMGYKNADVLLHDNQLLTNINNIQATDNIQLSNRVIHTLGACELDVEMETGTGKTYVYIKTMFELNRCYGWTKFIVVVPSIAIREGVKKSFDITQDHFMELYHKRVRYFIYSSDNLSQIDAFSQSGDISVMIINTQAFNTSLKEGANNKVARIIYDERDEFQSRRPIDVISANRPIIILDEPQKMGGAATQKALRQFEPLFTLNYSATHKEHHNTVYVLDALDAYNRRLVKRIEVVGLELKNLQGTNGYIYLSDIIVSKNAPMARIEFEVKHKNGIRRETKSVAEGDSLYSLSGEMAQYEGFMLSDIHIDLLDSSRSYIEFGNGTKMAIKEVVGNIDAEYKARIQIRETIKAHFRKESELFARGIKCLSLFFIDKVENYRKYDEAGNQLLGRYGEIFEEEYKAVRNESLDMFDKGYMAYLNKIEAHDTHAGYFSIDKKGRSIDSEIKRGCDTSEDTSAYDLILKNKERLLSLDEPVRFIFSHSALREGWDNPNVFQICSLRQSGSTSQKRQEVGRGLRLCVNNQGVRQDSETIGDRVQQLNCLTVIASEGYAAFSADLQKDISADLYDRPTIANMEFLRSVIKDENDAALVYASLVGQGYITKGGKVTEAFRTDLNRGALQSLPGELQKYTGLIHRHIQGIFDPSVLKDMVANGNRVDVPENKLNDNFSRREFQELWKRINHRYAYLVSFDSNELIDKAVAALDKGLYVTRLSYEVVRGVQQESLTRGKIESGGMMIREEHENKYLNTEIVSNARYDLLGEIASATKLTRRTVAVILSKIKPSTFGMYKANPEEFLQKVSQIIVEQKATMIVDRITYNMIDGEYDSSIFTREKHASMDKAYQGTKSIVDWVFTDGTAEKSTERNFVEKLDTASEVVVYAKLPKGFYIPTPVGNYSPDWAIAFLTSSTCHPEIFGE